MVVLIQFGNKGSQHGSDFIAHSASLLGLLLIDVIPLMADQQLGIQFTGRTTGNEQIADKILIASLAPTFSNIAGNGYHGPTHLVHQAILFFSWKVFCQIKYLICQFHGTLPYSQLFMRVFHRLLLLESQLQVSC